MPPSWPIRLLSSTISSDPSVDATASQSPNSTRSPARRYGSREPAHQRSAVSPSPSPGDDRQHSHTRSTSHPLPGLYLEKRKSATQLRHTQDPDDFLIDDALVPTLVEQIAESPTKPGLAKRLVGDGANTTRRCICCHSKVRFPRDLKVFRCTCCLTINDLEPIRSTARGTAHSNGSFSLHEQDIPPHRESFPIDDPQQPRLVAATPLSVQRTRAIIQQCLQTYLQTFLKSSDTPLESLDSEAAMPASQTTPTIGRPNYFGGGKYKTASASTVQQLSVSSPGNELKGCNLLMRPTLAPNRALSSPTAHRPARKLVLSAPATSNFSRPDRPAFVRRVTPPGELPRRDNKASDPVAPNDHDRYERAKRIFRPLEDYIMRTYGQHESLNASFHTSKPNAQATRGLSESSIKSPKESLLVGPEVHSVHDLPQIDPKMLLVGDIAENGDWWTGRLARKHSEKLDRAKFRVESRQAIHSISAAIDWDELDRWYDSVHSAGLAWLSHPAISDEARPKLRQSSAFVDISHDISIARDHVERALLKITENLLKRPGLPLLSTEDLRFLLIILSNPSLYPKESRRKLRSDSARPAPTHHVHVPHQASPAAPVATRPNVSTTTSATSKRENIQHTGILKRSFGIIACSPTSCHRHMIGWFCRLPRDRFVHLIDILASFVTYRLSRPSPQPKPRAIVQDGGLIPDLSGSAAQTSAQLQAASGLGGPTKKRCDGPQTVVDYSEDWQLKAAARVMALLFAANNIWQGKDVDPLERSDFANALHIPRPRAKTAGQLLSTSDFYNTLLDYHDLVADFKAWESRLADFTFCQYPFFLSMGAKIKILEFDAKRQMENKARQAYFDNVISRSNSDVNFHLNVRRECMVDDSLRQISEAVGAGQEELKKSLRVHFAGEEGVDAGGLRKEWFLLLVREIFDPNHGMFLYDEDSSNCYFNPHSFETSDQYHLVGALLGLAIYNSTILDIALPPFAFRKLLAAAPPSPPSGSGSLPNAGVKNVMTYTTADLAELRPALAAGLDQLLRFDGDVQSTFCQDFVISVPRYGTIVNVPLCPGGETRAVTNDNRKEYVNLYVRYLLDTSVTKQFEPFKRGFYTVCGGNVLSLFRAEEIELLIRGSEEALDVHSLQAVAVHENWRSEVPPHAPVSDPAQNVPVVSWFWDYFRKAQPADQRKLLLFITGSDRIPAVGATSLVLKIVGGGDGTGKEERQNGATSRFPIARTCFNMLVLWRYQTRQQMEEKLGRAILESEGFGLK